VKLKCEYFTAVSVKKKFTPEKAMKAQRGRSTPHLGHRPILIAQMSLCAL